MVKSPIRTLSGIAPMAVMVPPRPCPHGTCVYCPSLDVPQSYTPESPAVLRAKALGYDSGEQVKRRLEQFESMGHPVDKVELIVMGGTFLGYPEHFQYEFIKKCYDALNEQESKSLEEAKKLNEIAKRRCVALCIETRPDFCDNHIIKNLRKFGCTRVELGVQVIDDDIYERVNRGHTVKDVIDATRRLRRHGFKIGYHMMPGMLGSNKEKDIEMFKEIFDNPEFKPDQLKIYPCQVLEGAELKELYLKGEYKPYDDEGIKELLLEVIPMVPAYCRVMRVMREIHPVYLIGGPTGSDLRGKVEKILRERGTKVDEIRFREIGFALTSGKEVSKKIKIEKIEYCAGDGKEVFIQAVNNEGILFGLLRLRFDPEDKEVGMVREIHVYGPVVALGEAVKEKYQHKGIGKDLMKYAENLCKENGCKKIKVISGVGVRGYYRKIGYDLESDWGEYMFKII